jgi:hypothetical protein
MKRTVTAILTLLTCLNINAQDYSFIYRLNLTDQATFSVTCGLNEQGQWQVKRNSCNLYTPLFQAGELPAFGKRNIEVKLKLTHSGNLDDNDFAWIFYYIDEKPAGSKKIRGSEFDRDTLIGDMLEVPARSKYRIRVLLVCDNENEEWRLQSGDLFVGQPALEGDEVIEEPGTTGKIYVKKDRNTVHLHWNELSFGEEEYFTVERSPDGSRFQFAGYVKMNRTTGEPVRHSFIDSAPFQPLSYYRVCRMTSAGSTSPISDPVKVKF